MTLSESFQPTRLQLTACLMLAASTLGGCTFDMFKPSKPNAREPQLLTSDRVSVDSVARGRRLADQGLDRQALAEFEKAIENNPTLITAYMSAGDIYMKTGEYDMAASRFGTAAELAPGSFDANFKYGEALQALGRLVDSARAYLRALAIKPTDPVANMNLGVAYLNLGEADAALPYAERAVRLSPKNPAARTNLGAVYSALNRQDDAIAEYLQASELSAPTPQLLMNLAESLRKSDQLEQAANTLEQLVRIEPSAKVYERMGAVQFKLKNRDQAELHFRKAVEIDVNYYPAMNGVAVCLLNKYVLDNSEPARVEAVKFLRTSLQVEKNQPKVKEWLAKYQHGA